MREAAHNVLATADNNRPRCSANFARSENMFLKKDTFTVHEMPQVTVPLGPGAPGGPGGPCNPLSPSAPRSPCGPFKPESDSFYRRF